MEGRRSQQSFPNAYLEESPERLPFHGASMLAQVSGEVTIVTPYWPHRPPPKDSWVTLVTMCSLFAPLFFLV